MQTERIQNRPFYARPTIEICPTHSNHDHSLRNRLIIRPLPARHKHAGNMLFARKSSPILRKSPSFLLSQSRSSANNENWEIHPLRNQHRPLIRPDHARHRSDVLRFDFLLYRRGALSLSINRMAPCHTSYAHPGQALRWWLTAALATALFLGVLWPASSAHAQNSAPDVSASVSSQPDDIDARMKEMIKKVGSSTRSVDENPIQPTSVTPVNMEVHWRLWKRVATQGQPGTSELTAFRHDALSLGHYNLPVYAMAVLAIAKEAEQNGADPTTVAQMYREAHRLAPNLPYAELGYASYLYRNQITELPSMIGAYVRGIQTGLQSLDTRLAWELKFIVLALVAFLGASFAFLFCQLMRYFGILAYDATRLLPHGFSSNQSVILTIALVVVPGLLLRSPLLSLLILFGLLTIFQQINERIISALICAVLIMLPTLDTHVQHMISFPDSQAQKLMHAQYFHCDADCIAQLKSDLQSLETSPLLQYTYALAVYRTGDTARYQELIPMLANRAGWPSFMQGYVDNLHAAMLIATGNPQAATPLLDQARTALPESAAPTFNKMRIAQITDQKDAAERALTEAASRDLQTVTDYVERERRDVNSFLMAPPLPLPHFWTYHTAQKLTDLSIIQPIWTSLAGERIPLGASPIFGGLGILLLISCAPFRRMQRISTPCPRCGQARDPNDSTKMGGHHFCLPCFRTFQSGSTLEYQARIHNETVLGRRHRTQALLRRTFSLILPGSGHTLAGHAILGFTTTAILLLAALAIWQPMGIWRPPFELFTNNWIGQRTLAWIALGICIAIGLSGTLRDIAPTYPVSPDARHPQ